MCTSPLLLEYPQWNSVRGDVNDEKSMVIMTAQKGTASFGVMSGEEMKSCSENGRVYVYGGLCCTDYVCSAWLDV